jgi:hypothetical protein
MELSDLFSQLGSPSKKYQGEIGEPWFDFEQTQMRQINNQFMRASSQQKEMSHSSFLMTIIIGNTKAGSTAETELRRLQACMTYDQQAAEQNLYPPLEATPEQRKLALHHNLGVPEHEALFDKRLGGVLSQLCAAAEAKGFLAIPAGMAAPGVPAPTAASAAVRAAATANNPAATATAPFLMDPATGTMVCPYVVVALKFLAIASVRFGTAGQREETEFNAMCQGPTETEDAFAFRVKRAATALQHKNHITAAYAMERFLLGLTARTEADAVRTAMVQTANSSHTVDAALEMFRKGAAMAQDRMQAAIASQVAVQMLQPGVAKVGLGSGMPGKQQQRLGPRLAADDPKAQCRLHVGALHTNEECKMQAPRKQPIPAAGAYAHQAYGQNAIMDNMYDYDFEPGLDNDFFGYESTPDFPPPHYAATGMNPSPAGGVNPKSGQPYGWQANRVGQQGQGPMQPRDFNRFPRPPQQGPPSCRRCGMRGAHNGADCWYAEPDKAAGWWAPPLTASDAQKLLYKVRCKDLGITAKEPGTGVQRNPPAAAGLLQEYSYEYDCEPTAAADEPTGWEQCTPGAACCKAVSDNMVEESHEAAAGMLTRNKQPLSFLPPVGIHMRAADVDPYGPITGSEPVAATDPSTPPAALPAATHANLQMQFDFGQAGHRRLLKTLCGLFEDAAGEQLTAATASSSSSSMRVEPPTSTSNSSSSSSALTSVSSSSQYTLPSAAALQDTTVSLDQRSLPEAEFHALVEQYNRQAKHHTLNHFVGATPSEGVSLECADGRAVHVLGAKEDNGSGLELMSQKFTCTTGIHFRPLAPDQRPSILNIEGDGSSRIIGVTDPLTVILAKGTPYEARLEAKKGFYVLSGDVVARMYDILLGKELLDAIAGYVDPLTCEYVYRPHLYRGSSLQHTLPIRPWVPVKTPAAAALTTLTACSTFFCHAPGTMQTEDMPDTEELLAQMVEQGAVVPLPEARTTTLQIDLRRLNDLVAGEEQVVVSASEDSSCSSTCSESCSGSDESDGDTLSGSSSSSSDLDESENPTALRVALKAAKRHLKRLRQEEWEMRQRIDGDYHPVSSVPSRLSRTLLWLVMPLWGIFLHLLIPGVLLLCLLPLLLCDALLLVLTGGTCRPKLYSWVPKWCMQSAPRSSKLYYRLGSHHRAADGSQISVRATTFRGGNKPKVVKAAGELLAYELAQQDRAKQEAGGSSAFRSGRATCTRATCLGNRTWSVCTRWHRGRGPAQPQRKSLATSMWTTCCKLASWRRSQRTAETMEQHIDDVRRLLQLFKRVGLRAHPGKTIVATYAIPYLGHVVTADSIQPEQARVSAMQRLPAPTNADMDYSYSLVPRPGKKNPADLPSRYPESIVLDTAGARLDETGRRSMAAEQAGDCCPTLGTDSCAAAPGSGKSWVWDLPR